VANKPVRIEGNANISVILVSAGHDVADDRIAELAQPGDLVITPISRLPTAWLPGELCTQPRGSFIRKKTRIVCPRVA